jgi:hypothetical protein
LYFTYSLLFKLSFESGEILVLKVIDAFIRSKEALFIDSQVLRVKICG